MGPGQRLCYCWTSYLNLHDHGHYFGFFVLERVVVIAAPPLDPPCASVVVEGAVGGLVAARLAAEDVDAVLLLAVLPKP